MSDATLVRRKGVSNVVLDSPPPQFELGVSSECMALHVGGSPELGTENHHVADWQIEAT